MKKILTIFLSIVFTCISGLTTAQNIYPKYEYKVNVGYNIGGSAPIPLPVEIREIKSFKPVLFAPHVGIEATSWLSNKWGIAAQLGLDYKGFTVEARVKSLRTEMEMQYEKYVGHFTGNNKTEIKNIYVTLPVMATHRLSDEWLIQFGVYIAYLHKPSFKGTASEGYIREDDPTGAKTEVDFANFNFSKEQNEIDYGFAVAGEWNFYKRFALKGQLSWGTRPLFASDFTGITYKMYNIYGTIGFSYNLSR
ncbi:hypothetical protein M2138_001443 [Dysgonomonadaceae bacterium PH5-43]|nr:hypothetical protein [Dysgonomonadaceae bacterium PH5-43]